MPGEYVINIDGTIAPERKDTMLSDAGIILQVIGGSQD
jgi:hypothetical protein